MLYDKKWDKVEVETLEPWQTLLQATIDVLEKHGWCQGNMENGAGQHCLLGAIYATEHYVILNEDDKQRAINEMQCAVGSIDIARWNDTRSRTKAEVIDALRKAIASK